MYLPEPSSPVAPVFTVEERLRILLTPGIGHQTLKKILKRFQSFEELLAFIEKSSLGPWCAALLKPPQSLERRLAVELEALAAGQHQLIYPEHPSYPERLRHIPDAPELLWVKGNIEALQHARLVAMVGCRQPSEIGRAAACAFAKGLVNGDWAVVSGMARGIDTYAHQATLDAGGISIGVLGTGINLMYPQQNQSLYGRLIEQAGALISEYPLNTQPKPGHFPRRNRIISGLSVGVLVVEAAVKSGSLVTARLALEQGRDVFAVPGAITNPMAEGCHHLIQEGASLVTQAEDLLTQLSLSPLTWEHSLSSARHDTAVEGKPQLIPATQEVREHQSALSEGAKQVLPLIGVEPISLDDLIDALNSDITELVANLLELELSGCVENVGVGYRLNA